MIWKIEWDDGAHKELRKLDKQAQIDILKYLRERIANSLDPKRFGKNHLMKNMVCGVIVFIITESFAVTFHCLY